MGPMALTLTAGHEEQVFLPLRPLGMGLVDDQIVARVAREAVNY